MRAEPIRHRLDQRRAAADASAFERPLGDLVDRQDVVAVDPDTRHAVTDCFVGQRWSPVLVRQWGRDGPSVVLHVEDARRLVDCREVQRLVDVTLARRSIADERHGHPTVGEPR